jgi:hypothetical protein
MKLLEQMLLVKDSWSTEVARLMNDVTIAFLRIRIFVFHHEIQSWWVKVWQQNIGAG